jgi:GH25 family lysozyme M1 (1,4-beta-N-acetylmuramidase)
VPAGCADLPGAQRASLNFAPAPAGELRGIDVARWPGPIPWRQLRELGVAFAVVNATDGDSEPAADLDTNLAMMGKCGIARAVHHSFHAEQDATKQATALTVLMKNHAIDLPPVVDVERSTGSRDQGCRELRNFLNAIEKQAHRRAIVYSSAGVWAERMCSNKDFSRWSLWVESDRKEDHPTMFGGWEGWQFWQFGESGRAGFRPDVGRFRGSVNELAGLYWAAPTAAP